MLRKPLLPLLVAAGVTLGVGAACDYAVQREQQRLDLDQRLRVAGVAGQFRAALESELNATLYLTNGLVAYVATHARLRPDEVEPILKALYEQGRHLRNIGLAPGNRLTYIYPRSGNEKALGLYYPDVPEQWPAVERAMRERTPRLAGPVRLRQGGEAFIYRIPIFLGPAQEYWGILSTVVDKERLLAEAGIAAQVNDVQLALRDLDTGDTFVGDRALFAGDAVRAVVTSPGSSWELAVRPADGWNASRRLDWLHYGAWGLGLLLGGLALQLTSAARRRRLAELEIERSRRQLNEAQRIASLGSWALDMRTNRLSWSDEIYRIFGIPAQTPQSFESFAERVHPDDLHEVLSAWNAALHDGVPYRIEHRIVVDGEVRWVREQAEVTRAADGTPLGGVGTLQDITRQKLADLALDQLVAEQKSMLDNDLIGIVRVKDRHILWANPAFETMLGYGPGELVGTPTRQHYAHERDYAAVGGDAYPLLGAGRVFRRQIKHRRRDGGIVWLDFSASQLDPTSGESLWWVVDVTERKSLEHSLALSEERMELALAGAELGLWDLDLRSGKVTHNDRLVTMAGYTPGEVELSASALPGLLHPDDLRVFDAAFNAHIKGETPSFEVEYRIRTCDDRWLWIYGRGKVVERDADGRALRMTGTNLDISERKRNEAALRARESRLATLIGSMQDLVLVFDTSGTVVECFQPRHAKRPAYTQPDEAIGRGIAEIMPEHAADCYFEALAGILTDGQPRSFEYTINLGGSDYISLTTLTAMQGDAKHPTGFLAVIRDITAERHSQRQAERLAHSNALLLESVGEGIFGVDVDARLTFVNSAACKMLGYTLEELSGVEPHALFHYHRQDGSPYPRTECPALLTLLDGQTRREDNDWYWRKDGSGFPVSLTVTPVTENGSIVGAVVIFQDSTERKAAEARIHELAFYDPLTQLPNRRLLHDRLNQALVKSERSNAYAAILFLDLDNFKVLNDTRGHEAGDQLLEEVGRRLRECVRSEDTLARLGGDEFVLVIENLSAVHDSASYQACNIGEKVRDALCRPYVLGTFTHFCSTSIGITLFKGRELSVNELLRRADAAMYGAKAAGRNTIRMTRDEAAKP